MEREGPIGYSSGGGKAAKGNQNSIGYPSATVRKYMGTYPLIFSVVYIALATNSNLAILVHCICSLSTYLGYSGMKSKVSFDNDQSRKFSSRKRYSTFA